MRCIGLVGGLSAESTIAYYETLISATRARLGGWNSPRLLISSVNFADAEGLRRTGELTALADLISEEALRLQASGAEILAICSNTMHEVYDTVSSRVSIPLLHIADSVSRTLSAQSLTSVGFLGTGHARTLASYHSRITRLGTSVIMPSSADQKVVDRIIYDELCVGVCSSMSRQTLVDL